MRVTEAEAKQRWCRHARLPILRTTDGVVSGVEGPSTNRFRGPDDLPKCLASGCMAWTFDGYERNITAEEIAEKAMTRGAFLDARGARVGYCRAEPIEPKKEQP